ncbi:MAG: hypothetical protein RLZZ200_961 [Pseudomonadota bacterium]|jgi:hypothetical protein
MAVNAAATTTTSTGTVQGIGNIPVSVSYRFDDVGGSPLYLDFTGRVRLPTGDTGKGLAVKATDYGLSGEAGWRIGDSGIYVTAGRRFLGQVAGMTRIDGWQAGFGGWHSISDGVEVGAFVDWRDSTDGASPDPASTGAYVVFKASKSWNIELNGFRGLSKGSADFGAGLRASWRSGAH